MSVVNAESAVLGACLIDPQAYWRVADILAADDFSTAENRATWEAIGELSRGNVAPDFITVNQANPSLSADTLLALSNNTASAANVRGYAEWVINAATERRVRSAGQRIANLRGADSLAEAQRIMATCQPRAMSAVRPMRDFVQESVALMQQRCDATDPITGVPTSLEWLDEMTSGWQRGDLIVVAARPSVGKTALALQACLHAAKCGNPVFFASLEQSGAQLAERSIASLSGVSLRRILQPKQIEEHEWPRVVNAGGELAKLPISIDETGALTVDAISARARQVNSTQRLGLIAIDYLTQISPPRADKMADAIQIVTRSLKAMAKELSVPVILLSQLNREGDDRPALKHLRDSGAIEQDADVVVFLHRPDRDNRALVELTIAKQRNGPTDSTFVHADMERMRFLPTDERPVEKKAARGFERKSA
jgi:replicative DNA helicase